MDRKNRRDTPSKSAPLRLMKPDSNIKPPAYAVPPPPISVKMAKFRCTNDKCDNHTDIRDDIPETQAKNFTECPDCGAGVLRVNIYECAKCAKKTIVPYEHKPEACTCGHAKLILK